MSFDGGGDYRGENTDTMDESMEAEQSSQETMEESVQERGNISDIFGDLFSSDSSDIPQEEFSADDCDESGPEDHPEHADGHYTAPENDPIGDFIGGVVDSFKGDTSTTEGTHEYDASEDNDYDESGPEDHPEHADGHYTAPENESNDLEEVTDNFGAALDDLFGGFNPDDLVEDAEYNPDEDNGCDESGPEDHPEHADGHYTAPENESNDLENEAGNFGEVLDDFFSGFIPENNLVEDAEYDASEDNGCDESGPEDHPEHADGHYKAPEQTNSDRLGGDINTDYDDGSGREDMTEGYDTNMSDKFNIDESVFAELSSDNFFGSKEIGTWTNADGEQNKINLGYHEQEDFVTGETKRVYYVDFDDPSKWGDVKVNIEGKLNNASLQAALQKGQSQL